MKGMTKEEHKKLGLNLRKVDTELREVGFLILEAYGKSSRQYKHICGLSDKMVNFRVMMDSVCSGDLRDMSNEEWIANHFYLGHE